MSAATRPICCKHQTQTRTQIVRCVNEDAEQREGEREKRMKKVIVNKNLTG